MAPVRVFAVVIAAVYALVGLLGIVEPLLGSEEARREVAGGLRSNLPSLYAGKLLGLFPVNLLHSIVHVLIGVWGFLSMHSVSAARNYARGLCVVYLLLAVLGLIPPTNPTQNSVSTIFGLIPLHGHDVWLHALTALAAGYFGFVTPADRATVTDTNTGTTTTVPTDRT